MSEAPGTFYASEFYRQVDRRSPERVVPLVMDLLDPNSVVDVGCGSGAWLAAFATRGVDDYLGVDGEWVDRAHLLIEESRFVPRDLNQPLDLGRTFDLVVSLEVGEHLEARSARTFVDSLVALGPVVLFSAAVPGQGGENHINEQWPEYWARLFEEQSYIVLDPIRPRVWHDPDVSTCYAQNTFLFVRKDHLEGDPRLVEEQSRTDRSRLSIVHPRLFEQALADPIEQPLRELLRAVPGAAIRAIRRRVGR